MASHPPRIIILDDGLDPYWESLIRSKFSALGAQIYELNSQEEGFTQVQRILQGHTGPKEVHLYGTETEAPGQLKTSSGYVYAGAQVLFGGTTFATEGDLFRYSTLLRYMNDELAFRGCALPEPTSMQRTDPTPLDDLLLDSFKDEVIDGQGGLDTLRYEGPRFRHNLVDPASAGAQLYPLLQDVFPNHLWITTLVGQDFITGIERLQFSDRSVALDLADGESANTALRLLTAVVGKQALTNQALVGEIIAYTDRFDLGTLAQVLIDTGVMAQLAGGHSNAQLIQHLYTHIAGQGPSQAELQWTLDFVASNGFTQTDILEAMVGLPQTGAQAQLIAQTQVGVDYLPYELF